MFDIGFIELLLIGVVGLVVIGPERLPAVASKLGRWVGRARQFVGNVKRDIDREIRQEEIRQALERNADLDEIKSIINDSKYTIEDEVDQARQDYVVEARDDDPGRDSGNDQKQLIEEQEEDFDEDEDYAETGHTDYTYPDDEPDDGHHDKKVTAEKHGGRDEKSNG